MFLLWENPDLHASKERDAAKQRLFEHWWSCSICKEAARAIRTDRTKEPENFVVHMGT
jgi:hypothetical protein